MLREFHGNEILNVFVIEGTVNRRLALLTVLIGLFAGLGMSGCATQPTVGLGSPDDVMGEIVGKPQIKLPGASLAEVRSIAMGAAHSKGWTLVAEEDDRIVLQRPMDPSSPQAVALGAAGSTAPIVQVTSYFLSQPDGVLVALSAEVRTEGAEQTQQSVDYTASYQNDLQRSLESLRATWGANRERVAAALASQRSGSQSPEVSYRYGDPKADLTRPPSDPLKAVWAAETSLSGETKPSEQPPSDTDRRNPRPEDDDEEAIAKTRAPLGPPPLVAPPLPGSSGRLDSGLDSRAAPAGGGLLTLSQTTRSGMWAYYAEQYAMTRGCTLTDEGAVLIEHQPDHEIHEVACWNLPTFRLRCHNGVCRRVE